LMQENPHLVGTYVQTELGHGTFVRGMETTATYDPNTREFTLNSPTLTSIKFWPGTGGITANYALVMAKLIINNKEHGIHAFIVQLRSLETHKHMPGVETGDIGPKIGFESHDNGYLKFNQVKVPLSSMLMRNAQVTPQGEFKRVGSELVMYACMLILRANLCLFADLLLSISTTIAVRYSAVRRQTVALDG
jgi:acyl-CoA oxidase